MGSTTANERREQAGAALRAWLSIPAASDGMAIRAMMPEGPGSKEVVMRCHSAVLFVVAVASAAKGRSRPCSLRRWGTDRCDDR